jgi:hypothetical protein
MHAVRVVLWGVVAGFAALLVSQRGEGDCGAQIADSALYRVDDNGYVPSGWMGDGAETKHGDIPLVTVDVSRDHPHSQPTCWKITYHPGTVGWAAIAWQYPEGNWGDRPGKDLSGRGYRRVSVWARGIRDLSGNLPRVQFKAGGGTDPSKPYQASFEVESDFVTLSEEWKQYTLDISSANVKQVVSAITLVMRALDLGEEGACLFLDDIEYRQ